MFNAKAIKDLFDDGRDLDVRIIQFNFEDEENGGVLWNGKISELEKLTKIGEAKPEDWRVVSITRLLSALDYPDYLCPIDITVV